MNLKAWYDNTKYRSLNKKLEKPITLDGFLSNQQQTEEFITNLQDNFEAEALKYISDKNITSYNPNHNRKVVLQLIIKQLLKFNDITDFEYEQNPKVYDAKLNKVLQSKVAPSSLVLDDNIKKFVDHLCAAYTAPEIDDFSELVSKISTHTSNQIQTNSNDIEVKYISTLSTPTISGIKTLCTTYPSTDTVYTDFLKQPSPVDELKFINTGGNATHIIQELKKTPLSPSELITIQKAEEELSGKVSKIGTLNDQDIYDIFTKHPVNPELSSLKVKLESLVGTITDKGMLLGLFASKVNLQRYWENNPSNGSKNLSDFDKDFKKLQQKIISLKEDFESPSNTSKDPKVKLILEFFYQQFVEYEDKEITNVRTIIDATKDRIEEILQYKAELGIDNSKSKILEKGSKDYAKALSEDFKGVDSTKRSELRKSRIEHAKLIAYTSARTKSIDIQKLDSTGINDYIKEVKQTVFKEAITKDLDSLFMSYDVSRPRKFYNNITLNPFKKDIGVGILGGITSGFFARSAFKAGALATGGVIGGVAAGGILMKGATRRHYIQKKFKPSDMTDQQFNIDQIALNFTEATRDKTGSAYDSLFSDQKDIGNHYIKRQIESLKNIENINIDMSQFDSDIEDIRKQIELGSTDPNAIQNEVIKLQHRVTQKVTEEYIRIYDKVLQKIEEHRSTYYKKLAKEFMGAMALSAGLFGAGYLASGIYDWVSGFSNSTSGLGSASINDATSSAESAKAVANPPLPETNGITPHPDKPDPNLGRPIDGSEANSTSSNTPNGTTQTITPDSVPTTSGKSFTFNVLSDAELPIEELRDSKYRDGGIGHMLMALSNGGLTSEQALEIAKAAGEQGDTPRTNINLIKDGDKITLKGKALDLFLKYNDGKAPDVTNLKQNYLKIFGK